MDGKKISFGFKKTKKADKPLSDTTDDKKDYIECVEEQSIKIVGGEETVTHEPLVIPMKPNTLINSERLREIALKVESALDDPPIKTEVTVDVIPSPQNETLDQMAVRELTQDSKKEVIIDNPAMAIPTSAKGTIDGEHESTLDDYEAVPVQEFGVAMLRGMGWKPGQTGSKYKVPELRPKGLGLGADKVVKAKPKASKESKQEEMVILKNSFVKIVVGKYSNYYGKVVSLDEENGRIVVEIPLKKETVSLSEFMMHAVTKSEYDKQSKVINAESYEEYKKKETDQKFSKQDEKDRGRKREKENDRRDEKEKYRRDENYREDKEKDREGRRDESENETRPVREPERGQDKERNRDEKQMERKDEKERERKEQRKESDSFDLRRQRDQESANGRSRNRHKRGSSSSEERLTRKKKSKRRHSSSNSSSSLSEYEKKSHKRGRNKSRRSRSRSKSYKGNSSPEPKRDIDKKRKGKKKKRDRDRSPNYRKHRK